MTIIESELDILKITLGVIRTCCQSIDCDDCPFHHKKECDYICQICDLDED